MHSNDTSHPSIVRDDLDWAYGIMLAMREHPETPVGLYDQVEAFIDYYHRTYS